MDAKTLEIIESVETIGVCAGKSLAHIVLTVREQAQRIADLAITADFLGEELAGSHRAHMTAEAKVERLERVLAAEQGREGLDGWEWTGVWRHDDHSTISRDIYADNLTVSVLWNLRPPKACVRIVCETALDAMERHAAEKDAIAAEAMEVGKAAMADQA